MRIIVVDNDTAFINSFSLRCKSANVNCNVFASGGPALAEVKRAPEQIGIILVSKELSGDEGLMIGQMLRRDKNTAAVPYILMSSVWGKAEFAKHQKTEFGANAYFNKKGALAELEATIEAVTGFKFPAAAARKAPGRGGTVLTDLNVQLQPASEVVNIAEEVPHGLAMAQPIDLFGGEDAPAEGGLVSSREPSEQAEASVVLVPPEAPSAQTQAVGNTLAGKQPPEQAPATVNSGDGIDINFTSDEFQLEVSNDAKSNPSRSSAEPFKDDDIKTGGVLPDRTADSVLVLDMGADVSAEAAIEAGFAGAQTPELSVDDATSVNPAEASLASVSEEEAANDLPYLFAGPAASAGAARSTSPAGPLNARAALETTGGNHTNDDVETLKKYLTMREQDVSVLMAQLTYAKEELGKCEGSIKRLTLENEDLVHQINDLKKRNGAIEQELQHAGKSREVELEQLRSDVKSKVGRIKFLEDRLSDSAQQYEKLKERVRVDIRKIRVREKELESKLEILKKDSETLIAARENKILELKRKIDLLEFNYDTLQDKNESEKQNVQRANEKIERVLKVLKLALGVIEAEGEQNSGSSDERDDNPDAKVA